VEFLGGRGDAEGLISGIVGTAINLPGEREDINPEEGSGVEGIKRPGNLGCLRISEGSR